MNFRARVTPNQRHIIRVIFVELRHRYKNTSDQISAVFLLKDTDIEREERRQFTDASLVAEGHAEAK